jgi:uncharacterized protein (TIGR01777 family)
MRALITGATGLIGARLVGRVDSPVVLSRDPAAARRRLGDIEAHAWNPEAGPPPAEALRGVDAVFHLAGESVAEGRWTDEKKRRIHDSRVLGTRNLVAGLAAVAGRPPVLVSASAVGFYGDRGDEELDERSPRGQGFLADVCAAWEREAREATRLGVRVVCVRTGVVLAPDGGALTRILLPFRVGVGGRLGSGKQWMPWVHVDDVVAIFLHAALHAEGSDVTAEVLNAVGPSPVTNAEFTRALGRAVRRPAIVPVPRAALRVAFGELAGVLLASQRVLPRAALRGGFSFAHATVASALAAATAGPPETGR